MGVGSIKNLQTEAKTAPDGLTPTDREGKSSPVIMNLPIFVEFFFRV